jgi:hypothetical protein
VGEDTFKAEGKVLKEAGWLAVSGKKAAEEAAQEGESGGKLLTPYDGKEHADTLDAELREEATRPPPRFNEATLLGTMENAGKLVDDEELAEAMSERGLGTPATRAAIIEGLISDSYIERNQRDLVVTQKGLSLIEMITEIGVDALSSPELTGQWEYQLRQMEQRQLDRSSFMREIKSMASQVVDTSITEHLQSADRLCFSSQYYFLMAGFAWGTIVFLLGLVIQFYNGYNMFLDWVSVLNVLISLAIAIQVVSSAVIGAGLPLIVRRMGGDPAVVASPAISTIVDITGLLIYFTVASISLGIS